MRALIFILGWVALALGLLGALLPLVPTTPFLLLAVWCFARTSPRWNRYIENHPWLGPHLRAWKERRELSPGMKAAAAAALLLSVAWLVVFIRAWRA